ncbi:hypothetical protein GQF03_16210 [Sneathiella chungangensis]|uniref:Uncharacterized protein n=1 Tax=Sneathiella chungangensis TaxID=1418234 RepID=A0A845MJH2_9PROT|nr:hypothetical protein [Sneathiella chungangensis]MZR23881.1 hypothetical protein [Sneathiella chungangensis]
MIAMLEERFEEKVGKGVKFDSNLSEELQLFLQNISNNRVSFYDLSDSDKQLVYRLAALKLVQPIEEDCEIYVEPTNFTNFFRYFKSIPSFE